MFKVECPGCKAPYQVDERRVPSGGLKMRCPKCGTSFQVEPPQVGSPRSASNPVLGAALGITEDSVAVQMPVPPKIAQRGHKATMLGVAPGVGARKPAPLVAPKPAPADDDPYAEVDLPMVGTKTAARGAAPVPRRAVPADDTIDLPAPARRPPGPPPARGGPPPRPTQKVALNKPGPGTVDADLPAPAAARPKQAGLSAELELDLPEVGAKAPVRPGARPTTPAQHAGKAAKPALPASPEIGLPELDDIDLPAAAPQRALSGEFDFSKARGALPPQDKLPSLPDLPDLPSPGLGVGASRPAPLSGEFDLEGARAEKAPDIPLPIPVAAKPSPAKPRAPTKPMPATMADLPSPGAAARSPHAFGEVDLPEIGGGAIALGIDTADGGAGGLPSPAGDLPALGGVDLPSPGGSLPALGGDLPSPTGSDLPSPASQLPMPAGALPSSVGPGLPARKETFGELELPLLSDDAGKLPSLMPDPFESSLPPPPSQHPAPGMSELAGGAASAAPGSSEFDAGHDWSEPPTAEPPPALVPATGGAPVTHVALPPGLVPPEPKRSRRGLRIALGVFGLLVLGGVSLSLLPDVGPFGYYYINDKLKADEHRVLLSRSVSNAQKMMAEDTQPKALEAKQTLQSAQAQAKRLKALPVYEAFLAYSYALRFGEDPAAKARGDVTLDELAGNDDVEYISLARAARAVLGGQHAKARQLLAVVDQRDAKNVDSAVLRGELELRAQSPKAALAAFKRAVGIDKSPRTLYGLARAQAALGEKQAAVETAGEVLKLNPAHVGARILNARVEWTTTYEEKRPVELLDKIVKAPDGASSKELVEAQTLLGDIHLARSRISHAELAYGEALKIDPKASGALTGLGNALYQAGRYSEALARYEAAAQANPDDLDAKVGVAKAKLALEQLQDARTMLHKLRESYPKSMAVLFWDGKGYDAVGNKKEAEVAYRAAIEAGGKDPSVVDAYIALAQLLSQGGQVEEANKTLTQAKELLPNSPNIHKALGELALSQGRYQDAIKEFDRALELDEADVGSKFRLGVAHRRNRDFEKAQEIFDSVAVIDRDYPGLALERGLLYEASGRSEEALKAYESALSKAPNDPDLMLRVGCGKVAAGRTDGAEDLLRKVLGQRQNSAETNHCLGRALLLKGVNLGEALKTLERAVQLDPHRAEYYLYVGWAANEAGRVAKAEEALEKALELDQGLADAYWQRGVLRYRQGAVKDAERDLKKALELRPSRYEAHAALADTYGDLGRDDEAMEEWKLATAAQPDNATWRYRYGKLLSANRRIPDAVENLEKALELAAKEDPKPRWLYDAHLLSARSIGGRESAKHWEAFLRLAPSDNPYRQEAKNALAKLGRPWEGN